MASAHGASAGNGLTGRGPGNVPVEPALALEVAGDSRGEKPGCSGMQRWQKPPTPEIAGVSKPSATPRGSFSSMLCA